MNKSGVNFPNAYIALSDKKVMSFNPPVYGVLMRNIFTGDYRIDENSRVIPLAFEQGEKLIEGYWVLRGKNREKAVTLGNDGRYMKSAVLATGVF